MTGGWVSAIGAGCFFASTAIAKDLVVFVPCWSISTSKLACGWSALAGVQVTVWVIASNVAVAGIFVTVTRVSSRS